MLNCTVLDREGREHSLGDHIGQGLVLLALLRQYGCVGCNHLVTHLSLRLHELDGLGFTNVFVGLGTPFHLQGFEERMLLQDKKVRLFTSPDGAAHRAAQLPRSRWGSLGPKSLWQRARLLGEGFISNTVTGDPMQMSGIFFLRDGQVVWSHVADSPAGHPSDVALVQQAMVLALETA